MNIELSGLTPEMIFPTLSEAFGTKYHVKHAEYTLKIPEDYGSGIITGIYYPNGIGFICIDVHFKQDTHFIYSAHQVHPLRFVYCLKNQITHKFNDENIKHLIEQYHSAISASKYPHGHSFHFQKDHHVCVTFLEVDRKVFTTQLSQKVHDMDSRFYEMFFDIYATRTIYHNGLYSLHLAQIIKEIADFEHDDFIRTNFIGAKALEMLSFMLVQYEDDLRGEGNEKVLRKSELSAVHEAASYISTNLNQLPSVEQLARQVYLSASKLQEGFKLVHKCTVNDYIVNKRLEKSFSLLNETDMHIGEVVLEIGLSSRSYFSKIFKEKYKVSPIEIKKRGK